MFVIASGDIVSEFIKVHRAWMGRQVDGWVALMDGFAQRRGLERGQLTFIDVGCVIWLLSRTFIDVGCVLRQIMVISDLLVHQ